MDPFTATGAGTRKNPIELAFQREPAVEVNDLFGLGQEPPQDPEGVLIMEEFERAQ